MSSEAQHRPDAGREAPAAAGSGPGEEIVSLVRSEEELETATRWVERERVRLVKRVITETVTTTIELRREELHIEHIPTGDGEPAPDVLAANAAPTPAPPRSRAVLERMPPAVRDRIQAAQRRVRGGLIGTPFADDEAEITLLEERAVVTKRVVPRERVRLRKTIVTDRQPVREDVRRERIELVDEPAADRR
jgi:stress response protein YsnF